MPIQLMKLRGVPEDELEELAELLDEHEVDYYETTAGNWGISLPALWVKEPAEYERARALIDVYQQERRERARAALAEARAAGRERTFLDILREKPLQVVAALVLSGGLIYLSIFPFLTHGGE